MPWKELPCVFSSEPSIQYLWISPSTGVAGTFTKIGGASSAEVKCESCEGICASGVLCSSPSFQDREQASCPQHQQFCNSIYEQDHKPVKCTSEASVPRTHTTDADATGRISAHCPFEACTSLVPHSPTSLLQAWKTTRSLSSTPSTLGTPFSLGAFTGKAPFAQVRHHPHRFLQAVDTNIINESKYNNSSIINELSEKSKYNQSGIIMIK